MSKPVYGKSTKRSIEVEQPSALQWVLIIGMVIFLAWTPFQTGLFNGQMLDFERPIFWAAILACGMGVLWFAAYFKQVRLEDQRDWLAVAVLLLPLSYVVSLAGAASHYLAMNMVVIQGVQAILFITGLYLLRHPVGNRIIQAAMMAVSYLIVGFGLLHWFGQGKTAGAIAQWFSNTVANGIYTNAVMTDSNGLRLTSVFQYANTYAAFLMAFLFAAVFFITSSRKAYAQAFHSFMLVPIIVSLLLTLSRGGLVMLPVAFVLLLLFLKPAQQILWMVHLGVAGAASLLISKPVTDLGLQLNESFSGSGALKGWGYVLGVSALVGLLGWAIQRYAAPVLENAFHKWSDRKGSTLWIPIGSVVLGGLLIALFIGTSLKNLLPDNLNTRLDNINFNQHSVLERFTFYKDAMKVVGDYPIFGAGGGAWAALYEQYQNNPYTSRQAHNFFLQYFIEVGIVGFLIFMSFILYIFYKYIRGYFKSGEAQQRSHFLYMIVVLSILLHSILDFNMSYVFIGILVFLGLGGMAAAMDHQPVTRLKLSPSTAKGVYAALAGIGLILLLITSIRYVQASSAALDARQVAKTSTSFEEIKTALEKDLKIRSSHPDSVLLLSSLYSTAYQQTQDEGFYSQLIALLNNALEDEPYNKAMLSRLMQAYELKGQQDKAFALLTSHAYKFNWDIEWHEKIINQAFELGYQSLGAGALDAKDKYFREGIATFRHVQEGVEHLKTLPEGQMQGRPFEITPTMILNAGKMNYMINEPEQASSVLALGLQEDLSQPLQQDIAAWYMAALQKQEQGDPDLMNKLKQVDPTAEERIQSWSQLQF
ncbi:O-antigen ligase family protein [Paenibacillus algicola]|nr:O-antigen ligase family protein [Paenibacillus algicola]